VKLQGQSADLNVELGKKRALAVLLWSRLAKKKAERKGCFSGGHKASNFEIEPPTTKRKTTLVQGRKKHLTY
jgi:hypothetical protein